MGGTITFPGDIDWDASSGQFYNVLEYFLSHANVRESTRESMRWGVGSGTKYCGLEDISSEELCELRSHIDPYKEKYKREATPQQLEHLEVVMQWMDILRDVMDKAIAVLQDAQPSAPAAKFSIQLPDKHQSLTIQLNGCPHPILTCVDTVSRKHALFSLPLSRCPLEWQELLDVSNTLSLFGEGYLCTIEFHADPSNDALFSGSGEHFDEVWVDERIMHALSPEAASSLRDLFQNSRRSALEGFFKAIDQQLLDGALDLGIISEQAPSSLVSWLRNSLFQMASNEDQYGTARAVSSLNILHEKEIWCEPIADVLERHLYSIKKNIRVAATRCIARCLPPTKALELLVGAIEARKEDCITINAIDYLGELGLAAYSAAPLLIRCLGAPRYLPHALGSLYQVTEDAEICLPHMMAAFEAIEQFDSMDGFSLSWHLVPMSQNRTLRKEMIRLYPTLGKKGRNAVEFIRTRSKQAWAIEEPLQ